jgi:hypothetical protein
MEYINIDDFLNFTLEDLNITPIEDTPEPFDVSIKPAKSREECYEWTIPEDGLLCSPYKYDLRVKGNIFTQQVQLVLVDSETTGLIEQNGKEGCTVEQVDEYGNRELVIRFSLNFCSFHFKKRSFKLFLYISGQLIWTSTSFMIYARRRETPSRKPNSPLFTNSLHLPSQQPNYNCGVVSQMYYPLASLKKFNNFHM